MKIAYAFLVIATSLAAFGQADVSKQTVTANPPFTLLIGQGATNPPDKNAPDHYAVSGVAMSLPIRKTNITDHEIMKRSHAGGAYGYDINVRNSSGERVGPRHPNEVMLRGGDKGGFQLGAKDMVLQPGESVTDFVPLASWFDIREPGDYTVQVSAHISDDPKSYVVKSNIITITVRPEPEHAEPK